MAREKREVEVLTDLIVLIKPKLHELNRWFYDRPRLPGRAKAYVMEIWTEINQFRHMYANESKLYWDALNQVAMQSYKMIEQLDKKNHISYEELTVCYMELRSYIVKLEKSLIRLMYWLDTGKVATHIGGISWAAKLTGKSEVTIRRRIIGKKIRAYQITKFWWIPKEELPYVDGWRELKE